MSTDGSTKERGAEAADEGATLPGRGLHRLFRTSLIIIPIGVLGNLAFSLATTNRAMFAGLGERPKGYLLLAVALGLLPWLTNSLRLLIWTHFLGFKLRLREAFQMTLATDLGSAISPTAVGGGFLKWGMLVQRGVSPGAAVSITTFPILEDAVFFVLALPFAIVLSESWNLPFLRQIGSRLRTDALAAIAIAAAIAIFTTLAVRWVLRGRLGHRARRHGLHLFGRLRRRLRATWRDAREVYQLIARRGKLRFLLSLAITGVQWIARYSVVTAIFAYLGAPVKPVLFWLLQWVVFTFAALVPTPGGSGGAEASFYLIYSALVPAEVIGLATAGWRFLTFYFQIGLAAVLFALLDARTRRKQRRMRAV